MAIFDRSNWHENDKEILAFQEDFPEVYAGLIKMLEDNYDAQAVKLLSDRSPDVYEGIIHLIKKGENDENVQIFKEDFPDVYNGSLYILKKWKNRNNLNPPPQKASFQKGDFIGQKYEVFDVLGEGGFGIVYLVYSHETKNAYALKTFREEFLEDKHTRERFRKEALVWINLERHPFIVRAYFVEEISGRLYIAMEHIASDEQGLNTLDAYLKRRPPDLAQCLKWAIQFCYGMEYAYSKGIKAHRDIKPTNILIDQNKNVKITDFGLAGIFQTNAFSEQGITPTKGKNCTPMQTAIGTSIGTPEYMSPEQFTDLSACDERSDIYSFGIVLYQMASGGKLPFYVDNPTYRWTALKHFHHEIPVPKFASPLFPIIQRCLEKEPKKRYNTLKELLLDLEIIFKKKTGEIVKQPAQKELDLWELIAKGLSCDRLGLFDEAVYYYDQAIKLDSQTKEVWNNKGLALEHLGKFKEALECCNVALSLDGRYSVAWNNKGNCLDHLKKYNEAIECYKKAIEIDANFIEPWFNIGNTLIALNCEEKALLFFEEAIKINSSYSPAWTNKGATLLRLNRYEDAVLCIDKALSINPLSVNAWINKGKYYEYISSFADALFCYEKALGIAPKNLFATVKKGDALSRLGRFNEAMNCYQHVLEKDHGDIDALRGKIINFVGRGNLNDALMFSRMAIVIVPKEPSLLFLKATIEDNLGKTKDAIYTYQEFIKYAAPSMTKEAIEPAVKRLRKLMEDDDPVK